MSDQLRESNVEISIFAGHLTGREDRVVEINEGMNQLLAELDRKSKYLQFRRSDHSAPDGERSSG